MPDITNYAYVWYAKNPSQPIIQEEDLNKIYEIILNYSYPCYLSGSEVIRQLTPEEKTNLLQHELSFIEEKMETAGLSHIVMMQIPRVLYDLFNLYFTFEHTHKHKDLLTVPTFSYSCDTPIAKMNDYSVLTRQYTDSVKDNIFALNAFIVENIQKKQSYDEIADELVDQCWSLQIIHMFDKLSLEEAKKIVRQILRFENQDSKGRAILYRGSENIVDSLIDLTKNYYSNPPKCNKYMGTFSMDHPPCISLSFRSLSFNLSIFTGCVMDLGACTIEFFSKTSASGHLNDKIKLNIKKFLFGDETSAENSLFFIPPIHPYVQLYSTGELFHPRTKIGNDYIESKNKLSYTTPPRSYGTPDFVKGLFACRPNEETFIDKCDYLNSDKTQQELNALYQRYKSTHVVGTWSSDAARQSEQERFMKTRAETVNAAAAMPRSASTLPVLNEWKKLEAIPRETKFKILEDYYPQLKRRVGFMISNFMSKYLFTLCPQASVRISYNHEHERYYRRNVDFPNATFEFESKGDFEKCQSEIPLLTLEPKSLIASSFNLESLFDSARFKLLYKNPELYQEREKVLKIKYFQEQLGDFLANYYLYPEQTRDKHLFFNGDFSIDYKNGVNNYFSFMVEIFPGLQGQGPFPSPTRPVPVSASGGQTRCNLKRSIRRKNQFKPKNKTRTKQNNKTRTKPKNKTKKNK